MTSIRTDIEFDIPTDDIVDAVLNSRDFESAVEDATGNAIDNYDFTDIVGDVLRYGNAVEDAVQEATADTLAWRDEVDAHLNTIERRLDGGPSQDVQNICDELAVKSDLLDQALARIDRLERTFHLIGIAVDNLSPFTAGFVDAPTVQATPDIPGAIAAGGGGHVNVERPDWQNDLSLYRVDL